MLGQQKLFGNFFDEQTPVAIATRRGRSEELHTRRNEALIDRYYYYGKFTDKRYESILDQLSDEFFLTPVTISEVINDNFGKLSDLKATAPAKDFFKKKYPHLIW